MKKKFSKSDIILMFIFLFIITFFSVLFVLKKEQDKDRDTIKYNGKTYVYLEYNMDIFNYDFISNNYYEIDMIHPINHERWDMVYFNGDLFVVEDQVEKAISYYSNDKNYDWVFVLDFGYEEKEYPISIRRKDLKYIYKMDDMKKRNSLLFDEIEKMGSLKKISKDNTIYASIGLAYNEGYWYWRSEIIDDSKENDPEFVIKLPLSLNNKINSLIEE